MRTTRLLSMLILGVALVAAANAADWAEFRGPNGDGTSSEQKFPTRWDDDTNIKWKVKLPQPCNGSPIVSNGRVFLTCAQDPGGEKRSLYCFDRKTGKEMWVKTIDFGKKMPTHNTNPYCATTPAADGKRVVVWHGSAGLFCYDFDGKELWKRDLGEFRHIWGYASSPIIRAGKVILYAGPGKKIFLTSIDITNGKTIWETEEPQNGNGERNEAGKYMGSWGSPVMATVGGKEQLLCCMPTRLVAYDPASGKILWFCEGNAGPRGDLCYSSPIVAGDVAVAIGGFKGPGIGVKTGGSGNVTEKNRLWRSAQNPQNIGTCVVVAGKLYRVNAGPGTIECLDPKTGKTLWSDRGAGNNFWGSVIHAGGLLYATDQAGTTIVFKPNPMKFEQVARNPLKERCNSTPAFSDGQIFLRTFGHVYCIE